MRLQSFQLRAQTFKPKLEGSPAAEQLIIATTPPDTNIPAAAKPPAGGTAMTGSVVRIDWTKRLFDGVFIDSQRNEESA